MRLPNHCNVTTPMNVQFHHAPAASVGGAMFWTCIVTVEQLGGRGVGVSRDATRAMRYAMENLAASISQPQGESIDPQEGHRQPGSDEAKTA